MEAFFILVGFIFILLILAAPKIASQVLWFALLCYPHQTNKMVPTPLGMGGDDLLISTLFVSVALRCILNGRLNFGTATRVALLFSIVEMISEFTGALVTPGLMAAAYKKTLKGAVYVMFAFVLDNTLDNSKDVKKSMYFMLAAAGFGAITAIGQKYVGGFFQIFTPVVATTQVSVRGGGSFVTPGGAGIVIMLMLILCVCLLQAKQAYLNRGFVLVVLVALVGGLGSSVAGSSVAGTGAALGLMAVFGRNRSRLLAVMVVGGLIVATAAPFVFNEVLDKLSGPKLEAKLTNRANIWWHVISHPSPYQLLCGEGVPAELRRLGGTPHNGYLYHSMTMGLGGAVWAVWFYWQMFFRGRKLGRRPHPGAEVVGRWSMWVLVGIAVANITTVVWEVSFARYLLYAAVAYTGLLLAVTANTEDEIWLEEEDGVLYSDTIPPGWLAEGAYPS